MNTEIRRLIIGIVSLVACGTGLQACPPTMEGGIAIVVHYTPGKHWNEFSKYAGSHLKYLHEQMNAGNIQFAGPYLEGEDAEGGLTIYSTDDEGKVQKLIHQDALVRENIVEAKLHRWLQCSLKKGNSPSPR